jgi:hypothetical protein
MSRETIKNLIVNNPGTETDFAVVIIIVVLLVVGQKLEFELGFLCKKRKKCH